MMKNLFNKLGHLIEKKKLMRRITLGWGLLIVSTTTGVFLERIYNAPEAITSPVANVLISIVGLVAVVGGIYNHSRGKEDQR